MNASDDLRAICDDYWETTLEASPLFASFLGDHRYDDRADDLTAAAEQRLRDAWLALRERTAAVDAGGLDETDRVTHALLVDELDDSVRRIDLRLAELACDQMQGPHAELLIMAGQLRAPEPEHARMALARIPALGVMLDQATARFREGLAAGRTPARINVDRSLSQIDKYLASALERDPFALLAGPEDWDGTEAWREEMTAAVRDQLRPAFGRYREVLASDLLPAARPDDRPGLCWLGDDGAALYQALVELHTGLPLTPDELHEAGLAEVTGTLRDEFATLGELRFDTAELPAIFSRLLDDPELRYRDAEEVLAHARTCLDAARDAIGHWFGILPQAPCVLTPVPDYLAADAPAAYYTPPAPDGSRPGEYHVNLHDPTGRGRTETASIAYHEAIPGHHLQLAIASERTDLPAFRRLSFRHTAFVEGWALYTERLADEMGLYPSDLDRLGMLTSDAWRACRLVVDTGLHARRWTRAQAIDFMAEHAPLNHDEIVVEVDRYIGMPGQALAYKVGQREILRLRESARQALGDRFDIRAFHDTVLGAATVSLPVLRARVGAWLDDAGNSATGGHPTQQ